MLFFCAGMDEVEIEAPAGTLGAEWEAERAQDELAYDASVVEASSLGIEEPWGATLRDQRSRLADVLRHPIRDAELQQVSLTIINLCFSL